MCVLKVCFHSLVVDVEVLVLVLLVVEVEARLVYISAVNIYILEFSDLLVDVVVVAVVAVVVVAAAICLQY